MSSPKTHSSSRLHHILLIIKILIQRLTAQRLFHC